VSISSDEKFLEECQNQLAEAKKVYQETQQEAAAAQQKFVAAQGQLNIWTGAVNTVMVRLEKAKQAAQPIQPDNARPEKPISGQVSSASVLQTVAESAASPSGSAELNKTEMIRDVLRRNPSGMTPAEVWKGLNGQIDRAYVYSVLKRLKDRDQIAYRRKKYSLKTGLASKPEEGHPPMTLQ
jgi:hypothetical protein